MGENTVLQFTTETPKVKTVEIDGVEYELVPAARQGVGDGLFIECARKRLKQLIDAAETDMPADAEFERANSLMRSAVGKILKAPPDIIATLSIGQQIQIVEVWNKEMEVARDPLASGSGESSPPSSASTEGTPSAGS